MRAFPSDGRGNMCSMEDGRRRYDWEAIRGYYEAGHSVTECQERFGISTGAWYHAAERGDIVPREMQRRPRGQTRSQVALLLEEGLTPADIARLLGVSKPTVSFHMRKLGIEARTGPARRYDWEAIRAYYLEGHSATACQRRFGFSRNAWADAIERGVIEPRPRLEPFESLLAAGRSRSRSHVKARLLLAGLKDPRCEHCGLSEWQGRRLSLELHHVNGDGLDNRVENLLLLCPNCHSQTDTWGGRNKLRRAA